MDIVAPTMIDAAFALSSVPLALLGVVRGKREMVIAAMCVVQFFATSCLIVFAVLPQLVAIVASSPIQASFLIASPVITTVVLPVVVSLIARRFGGRIITVMLCLISGMALAVACALLQWASLGPHLYPLFVVLGLCLGCGSVTFNAAIIQCSWWCSESKQGAVSGLLLFFWVLGMPVFGVFAAPMVTATSSSSLLLLWCLCVFLAALIAAVLAADPPSIQLGRVDASSHYDVLHLATVCFGQEIVPTVSLIHDLQLALTSCHSLCIVHIAGVTLGCFLGFLVWLPSFFVGMFGVTSAFAGYVLFGYGSAAAVTTLVAGFVSDKLNVWVVTVVFLIISFGSFVCLAASTNLALSIVATILIAVGTMSANTCCYKLIMLCCRTSMAGTVGCMETMSNLIGFVLPFVFGPIAFSVAELSQGLRVGLSIPAVLLASCLVPFAILIVTKKEND
jgi:nitrate/nitrite transporter NarK